MPLYEYECEKCHRRTEKIESVNGPHLKKCPHCGGKVERLLSSPAIQFKGTGWYVTDYAGKKAPAAESGSAATAPDASAKESAGKETAAKESATKESSSKEKKAKKKD